MEPRTPASWSSLVARDRPPWTARTTGGNGLFDPSEQKRETATGLVTRWRPRPRGLEGNCLRPVPAHDVDDDVGRSGEVVDGQRAVGAELGHDEVRDALARNEV